jgi:DNA-directed RNA polymerase subunit RPC12/RpoP
MFFFRRQYCHLCEENNIEYKCSTCNYILCKECLQKMIRLNCPQCRNEIILTENQIVGIRRNNTHSDTYDIIHNEDVNIYYESRAFFMLNRYRYIHKKNIFYNFFVCLISIIFQFICYFIGYYINQSHKNPFQNLFLGFLSFFIFYLSCISTYILCMYFFYIQ